MPILHRRKLFWQPKSVHDAANAGGGSPTITLNAAGSEGYQSSSTNVYSYTGLTVLSGTNIAIVLTINWDAGTSPTLPTAIWDLAGANQAFTVINQVDGAGHGGGCALLGLAGEHGAIATGNKTITLGWVGNSRAMVAAVAFDHVDQTGGTTSFFNDATANNVTSLTVSSTANDALVGLGNNDGAPTGTPTGTAIYTDNVSGAVINCYANYALGNPGSIGTTNSMTSMSAVAVKAG